LPGVFVPPRERLLLALADSEAAGKAGMPREIQAASPHDCGSPAICCPIKTPMTHQDRYDDAMFDYSQGEMDGAMAKLKQILQEDPCNFDAQLALAMCCCRKGDLAGAIAEGHKAETLNPKEPLVHTNLSLFYVKAGDKQKAEHHGALARMASWKDALAQSLKPPSPPPGAATSEAVERQNNESNGDGP
jgi:predicted Zn-dependent protease